MVYCCAGHLIESVKTRLKTPNDVAIVQKLSEQETIFCELCVVRDSAEFKVI